MAAYYDKTTRTWFCKFRYRDWTGAARSTTKRGFPKKKDALAYEMEFKETVKGKPDITIGKLAEEYLADCKTSVRETTYITLESHIRRHILPMLARLKLTELTPSRLRKWQQQLGGLAPSTTRMVATRLSAMLNFAVKYYGLQSNPFTITGKAGTVTRRTAFLEADEFQQLLECVDDEYYRLVFSLLFYGGFRIGELKGLEPADFDFSKYTISINKQYSNTTNKITPPKTANSVRVVSMPSSLMRDAETFFNLLPMKGHPFRLYTEATDTNHLHKYLRRAGLPAIGLHGLRHSHASMLIRSGVPVIDIARRLGNTPDMVLKTYAHVYKDSGDRIANMLEKHLKS